MVRLTDNQRALQRDHANDLFPFYGEGGARVEADLQGEDTITI